MITEDHLAMSNHAKSHKQEQERRQDPRPFPVKLKRNINVLISLRGGSDALPDLHADSDESLETSLAIQQKIFIKLHHTLLEQ